MLLEDIDGKGEAESTAERILSAFREPLILHGEQVFVKPSVGVALGEPRVSGVEEVLRRADIAMYAAKRGGKGCFQLFDEKLDVASAMEHDPARGDDDRLTWFVRGEEQREQIVAVLAADDSITTVFQPLVDLRTGVAVGYEALSRFKDPDRRPPNAWFAQAPAAGSAPSSRRARCEVALAGARHRPPGTYVSLNLSPSSLMAETSRACCRRTSAASSSRSPRTSCCSAASVSRGRSRSCAAAARDRDRRRGRRLRGTQAPDAPAAGHRQARPRRSSRASATTPPSRR